MPASRSRLADSIAPRMRHALAVARVLRGYKNTTEERVRVEANASTAACGYDFEIGQR